MVKGISYAVKMCADLGRQNSFCLVLPDYIFIQVFAEFFWFYMKIKVWCFFLFCDLGITCLQLFKLRLAMNADNFNLFTVFFGKVFFYVFFNFLL